jgi:RNA polymerase sigma-70 factor (ECF subfamily)
LLAVSEVTRLVARAKNGETGAFSSLVSAHLRAAYLTALAIVGRPEDAEDVVQEAFLAAFEHLESCREPARFPGWLLRIVRNRSLNWLDRRRLREVNPLDTKTVSDPDAAPIADCTLRERLLDALGILTATQREVVLLHDLEGWTHAEIAEALELTELMSRQHLFTARGKLRLKLAEVVSTEVKDGK